jgi:antitoxin (DNA-binding transcriptional repressor) of toxin-antitoxin stability system
MTKTIMITRHGRPISRIVPATEGRRGEIDKAIDAIKALRKRTGKITVDQLLATKHEGHRY